MPTQSWRVESAYLLPYPLTKAEFGSWWAVALDEGLSNHGECFWSVDLWLDPQQIETSSPESRPSRDWRPAGNLQLVSPGTWHLQPGCVFGFRGIEGMIVELDARAPREGLLYFGLDARFFDDQLQWRDMAARDRLMRLFARGLQCEPQEANQEVLVTPDRQARGMALKELLRKG